MKEDLKNQVNIMDDVECVCCYDLIEYKDISVHSPYGPICENCNEEVNNYILNKSKEAL